MPDLYRLDELLTAEERAVRDRVRAFCEAEVLPGAANRWERATVPRELLPRLGALGVTGVPELSATAEGLVAAELAAADGSLYTIWAAQGGLTMRAIAMLGSAEQKARWLPRLATFEAVGAFALTEPEHGSDAVLLETRARRNGEGYDLDGRKRWIGNATFADVLVVWARDETDGQVGGFLVERGAPGLVATAIGGKTSHRAVSQADIVLEGVPAARLPGALTFRDTAAVLRAARAGIAWGALGHATACYDAARAYVCERTSFGRPLAGYQLVQAKLAGMLAEVTSMQLMCLRLSQLAEVTTDGMASLAKMHCARAARRVAADARDLLGGNGILLENHVARHQADLEGLFTYEGTDHIQALIVGREVTGVSAFSIR